MSASASMSVACVLCYDQRASTGEPALSGKLSDVFLTCEGGADDAAMALDGVHAFNCNDLKVSSDLATQAWKNHTQIAQKLRDLVVPLDSAFLAHTPFHVASAMDLISFDPYPKLDLGDAFTFECVTFVPGCACGAHMLTSCCCVLWRPRCAAPRYMRASMRQAMRLVAAWRMPLRM